MNHSDITRALDVLKGWQILAYHNDDGADEDSHELYWALEIVFKHKTRQKAEIERWQKECAKTSVWWKKHFDFIFESAKETVRAEAIKEFAERLKEKFSISSKKVIQASVSIDVLNMAIESLVKEMERERE